MIKYLNLALLLVITLTLSGQNIDTSVYNNRFEKIKFIEVQEGDELSIADLLYAINYDKTTYEKSKARIQKLKNSLDDLNVSSKPLKKQVKIIYKQVHA